MYTAGPVLTNPNIDPLDELPDTVTLYISDQDPIHYYMLGEDGVSYIKVTGPSGAAVDADTTMAELEAMDGTVLFPGAVAPPVYTPVHTFTNPNPAPGEDPASVTVYISDQDLNVYILGQDGVSYIEVTVPEGITYFDEIGMVDLKGMDGTVLFPNAVAPPVYTPVHTFTNPNPEPGEDPASVTVYILDQDLNVYILGQDGLSYIQWTVPEGITYFDEIGMVDLKGMDGTVLFPGAVAPPEPEYTLLAYLTNPNPAPETVSDGPASVALYTSDQDSDTYMFDGGPVRGLELMV